jgi:two-component system cell cycle sensor histidine kinase/response regulator CckA
VSNTPTAVPLPAASPEPAVGQSAAPDADGASVMDANVAHKQKLDCAMQLIRTVALDFNNALTSILGHTSLLLSKIDPKNPMRGSLVEIEKSAERAAEVANDLAAFSRQDKDTKAQTIGNLNEVLRRTVEFFRETHPSELEW